MSHLSGNLYDIGRFRLFVEDELKTDRILWNYSAGIMTYDLPKKQDEKKAAGYRTLVSDRLARFSKRAARAPQQTLIMLTVC